MAASTVQNSPVFTLTKQSDREIVMTRIFDAPRHLVFEALTKPEHLTRWFGPHGWTLAVCEVDFRLGGAWRFVLRGPDGKQMGMRGVYREIAQPGRFVSTESFDDYPGESLNTLVLSEEDGKTTLTITVRYLSGEIRDAVLRSGMERGASQTYDRLAQHLGTQAREIVITRVFDAPREVVFKAWTDPQCLKRWWGPKNFTNPVCEVDVRPGGAMRIHMRAPDGTIYPMTGVYREIAEPERLVFAASALDAKGDPLFEQVTTVTFAEAGAKTKLTVELTFSKVKPEAAPHLAGAEMGWNMSLDRLAEEVGGMSAEHATS